MTTLFWHVIKGQIIRKAKLITRDQTGMIDLIGPKWVINHEHTIHNKVKIEGGDHMALIGSKIPAKTQRSGHSPQLISHRSQKTGRNRLTQPDYKL